MTTYRRRRRRRRLGRKQRGVLQRMYRADQRNEAARSWYAGCGWVWKTASETTVILESLHRRGLVEKTTTHITPTHYSIGREHDRITYTLTDFGRKIAAANERNPE